jgi:transcriptional regulator of arginine metabolism
MSEKSYRQDAIRKLISEKEISNQDELMHELSLDEIIVTQATLSRDLRELKISKLPNLKGEYVYKLTEIETKLNSTDTETISFTYNLAVVKTQPGFATRIALEIDQTENSEIIGTIAGDDTIFIALRENYNKEITQNFIQKIIPNIKVLS